MRSKLFSLLSIVIVIATLFLPASALSQDKATRDDKAENTLASHLYLPYMQTEEGQAADQEVEAASQSVGTLIVNDAIQQDLSQPLTQMKAPPPGPENEDLDSLEELELPIRQQAHVARLGADAVAQSAITATLVTTDLLNFAGLGEDDYGMEGPFGIPPDTNLAVGDTQVVQWVNTQLGIFNKADGSLILGPLPGNTPWAGFGGLCEANNDGDPIVQFDKLAHRWILTQFALDFDAQKFLQCVAISTTADATGTYYRYAFAYSALNDYPKLGVWPTGYFVSYNLFDGTTFAFVGGLTCAWERSKMLAGRRAKQICFLLPNDGGLLPADFDGTIMPPKGAANTFAEFYTLDSLALFRLKPNFDKPTKSKLSGPFILPVAEIAPTCFFEDCIPQLKTKQTLDPLSEHLMYRLAYRRFADGHEALLANQSVDPGDGTSAVRWYEIRDLSNKPFVYQSGTYAPDDTFRWMGSMAMDKMGNMAVGYSVSSHALNPGIRYTGRLASDPLGELRSEKSIQEGGGSQTQVYINRVNRGYRWGDYSSMSLDPADDCTFWYTTEYLKQYGIRNWSTKIASFKFPDCH
jgi:hypothetical protein